MRDGAKVTITLSAGEVRRLARLVRWAQRRAFRKVDPDFDPGYDEYGRRRSDAHVRAATSYGHLLDKLVDATSDRQAT